LLINKIVAKQKAIIKISLNDIFKLNIFLVNFQVERNVVKHNVQRTRLAAVLAFEKLSARQQKPIKITDD